MDDGHRPQKIVVVAGIMTVLISGVVTYVHFFGEAGLRAGDELLALPSQYSELAQKLVVAVAGIQSVQASGSIAGNLSATEWGLAGFRSENVGSFDLRGGRALQLEWQGRIEFFTPRREKYTFTTDVRRLALHQTRPTPENFYFEISHLDVPKFIEELVRPLSNQWITVSERLMERIVGIESDSAGGGGKLPFSEEQFLRKVRQSLQSNPALLRLVRKFDDGEHYQFVVHHEDLAKFLADLFGALSGKPFSREELAVLTEYLSQFRINGEIWPDPQDGLPTRLLLNWNNWLRADLSFAEFDQPVAIGAPAGAQPLEKLLE